MCWVSFEHKNNVAPLPFKRIPLAAMWKMDFGQGRKSGSREIIARDQKAIEIIQVRSDGGLDQGSSVVGGARWLGAGYSLKVEPSGLANRPDSALLI